MISAASPDGTLTPTMLAGALIVLASVAVAVRRET
jgi:hypothetical protein